MGTSLTGLTPATTYDALIKVGDNGPLTGSLKTISDGLGNDSALALSTAGVGIGTTSGTSKANILSATVAQTVLTLEGNYASSGSVELLEFNRNGGAVSGAIKYQDADTAMSIGTTTSHAFLFNTADIERLRITSAGNIGIGTSSPSYKLDVDVSVNGDWATRIKNDSATGYGLYVEGSENSGQYLLGLNNGLAYKMVVQGDGNVGIGTSTPGNFSGVTLGDSILDVNGVIQVRGDATNGISILQFGGTTYRKSSLYSSVGNDPGFLAVAICPNGTDSSANEVARFTANGLTFNGDTAAANALDDYEEGTFTATISPSTSGTITSGASFNTWSYTKIGRQVTINGAFVISSVSSPVGDLVNIGGLPFTVRNSFDSFGAVSVGYADASASYAKSVLWSVHGTNTTVINMGIDASTVAASDEFYVTATYFTN